MKSIILVALALVAVAVAAPSDPIAILRSSFDTNPEGTYGFSYETENGIIRAENGELKQAVDEDNKPRNVIVVRGSYTYTDPNGKVETINYSADENGFRAEGDSIPKVPARR